MISLFNQNYLYKKKCILLSKFIFPFPQSDFTFNHPFKKDVNVFLPERFVLTNNL